MSTQVSVTSDELIFQRLLEHQDEQLAAMVKNQALHERLRGEIRLALIQIDDPTVHDIAETVFGEIVRVFARLTLIETNLHKLDTLLENLSLLDVLQYEIHNFVDFLENEAMRSDAVDGKLHDVLDGICYGISHDLKRIFERELAGGIRDQSTPIVYGKILHAHGLLTNCFQQSVITLMQVFNPTLDPLQIFDDFEERVRQSLTLCNDLSSLMRVARHAEADNTPDALRQVVQDTLKFRDGSMHYLMYRDWRGYEKLALSLIASIEANHDSRDLLHQFGCYLEVLYGHVKMRAVLRDMFPSTDEGVDD